MLMPSALYIEKTNTNRDFILDLARTSENVQMSVEVSDSV
jgi:hypothetical protein